MIKALRNRAFSFVIRKGFVFIPPRRVYKRRYKKWYKKLWCYTKIVVRRIAIITLNHPLCEKIVLLLSIYLLSISRLLLPKTNFKIWSFFSFFSSMVKETFSSTSTLLILFIGTYLSG